MPNKPDVLPDVDAIPDQPQEMYFVKRSLRWLNDRLQELKVGVDGLKGAGSAAQSEQAAKIADLEKRLGVLEREPAAAAPDAPPTETCCRLTRTANQSIPSGTWTAIDLTSEIYDHGGFHDASNDERATAPVAGVYHIEGSLEWDSALVAAAHAAIWRAGAENGGLGIVIARDFANVNSIRLYYHVSVEYHLTAGQWVELRAFQASGGPIDVVYQAGHDDGTEGSYTPVLHMHLLRED